MRGALGDRTKQLSTGWVETWAGYRAALVARDYRLLFFGQAVSQFGDWTNRVALLILVYRLTGQSIAVALVLFAQIVPRLIILPFGGVLADRLSKRRVMIAADLLRTPLAVSFIFVTTPRGLPVVCAAVIATQALSSLFNPARNALMPSLVPREHLGSANALTSLSAVLAFFVGPALGSLIIPVGGTGAVFIINAATFLFSAALLGLMRPEEPARADVKRNSIGGDLSEGSALVLSSPVLRILFGGSLINAAIALGLNVTLVALLVGPLGRSADALGTLMAMVGLGAIVGSAIGVRVFRRFAVPPLVAAILFGLVLDMAVIGAVHRFAVVAAALFFNGFFAVIGEVTTNTAFPRLVAPEQLGRIFGFQMWTIALGQVVGVIGGGLLPRAFGITGTVLAMSGGYFVVFAFIIVLNRAALAGAHRLRALDAPRPEVSLSAVPRRGPEDIEDESGIWVKRATLREERRQFGDVLPRKRW